MNFKYFQTSHKYQSLNDVLNFILFTYYLNGNNDALKITLINKLLLQYSHGLLDIWNDYQNDIKTEEELIMCIKYILHIPPYGL